MSSLQSEDVEKYVKVRLSRKTYCQDQTKRLVRMATEVNNELGPWKSELYICQCILRFQAQRRAAFSILEDMNEGEKVDLNNLFASLSVPVIDMQLKPQDRGVSPKARQVMGLLAHEMSPGSAGIIS